MNTKNVIIVSVLGIVLVGLVVFMFAYDANDRTVLKVGDVSYDISDFESYIKVWNYENDSSKSDIDQMYSNYQSYKAFATRAIKAGVTLSGDELPAELESGDEAVLLEDYNLTSGEYMRVKTEMAKANKLYGSAYELAKISPSYFDQYKESLLNNNPSAYATYGYRVVEIALDPEIEVEESGDVSGDVVEETSGEKAAKEEQRKVDAKAKTEKVLEIVKKYVNASDDEARLSALYDINEVIPQVSGDTQFSGDIFEYISQNTSSIRYTQNSSGFSAVGNGEIDYASKLYMAEDMTGSSSYLAMFGMEEYAKSIVENVQKLKSGDFSDIFESSDGYAFVYLESLKNELNEDDETRFNNEIANAYIGQNANMVFNKTLVKSIDLEKLMPKVAREAEEARNKEEQNVQDSGDGLVEAVQSIASGDNYSIYTPSGESDTIDIELPSPEGN